MIKNLLRNLKIFSKFMALYELLTKIKRRSQSPRVYAVVVENITGNSAKSLSLVMNYTLEEAIIVAQAEASTKAKNKPSDWKLVTYVAADLENLIAESTGVSLDEVKKVSDDAEGVERNKLMNSIVSKKDRKLFKKNIHLFSAEEKKLIEEKLK